MQLRCIIVDDSTIQRVPIAKLADKHPNLTLVAEYSNAIEARIGLKNNPVDLIFLDIEMPVTTGFELLDSLKNPPQVIVVTAKTEYAMKAFDYGVTDYLHKPVSKARFNLAVKKTLIRHSQMNWLSDDGSFIMVKTNFTNKKVILNTIKWIEALGDYVKLVTIDSNIVVLSTLKAFEQQLPTDKFQRIHKSYIVNLEKIENYNSKNVEVNGKHLPISRSKKPKLDEALSLDK